MSSAETPAVWLCITRLCASDSEAMPLENCSAGGPQFCGCWLLPVIPASAAMFFLFAKFGVRSSENRLNWTPNVPKNRGVNECRQFALAVRPNELVLSIKSNRLGAEDRVLWN